jgi:hypothetical protein
VAVETDPGDKAIGSKLLAAVHKLLADQAAEVDNAAGMSPALKLAQRISRRQGP